MIMHERRVAPIRLSQNVCRLKPAAPPRDRQRADHAERGRLGRRGPADHHHDDDEDDQQEAE